MRALFIDLDNKPLPTFAIEPNIIVQRDETHNHAYWLLAAGENLGNFESAQRHLIKFYGSDRVIHDLPRVMRLPGFIHKKGAPVAVKLLRCEAEPRRTIAEILAQHPVAADPAPPSRLAHHSGDARFDDFVKWAAPKETHEGQRNQQAFLIACQGKGRGFTQEQVWSVVSDYCRRSDLPEAEGRGCLESAWKRERTANPPAYLTPRQEQKVREETAYQSGGRVVNESPNGPAEDYSPKIFHPRDLLDFNTAIDPDCLIGKRWLGRGGSAVLVGQAGAGKSTMTMQHVLPWALGNPVFGVTPKRPLRSLIIQAENDQGDLAEQMQGVVRGMGIADRISELNDSVVIVSEASRTGESFARAARLLATKYKPDLFWVDPLLSFIGGAVKEQEVLSHFLRNLLTPIAQAHGFAWMIVHHTNKPSTDPKSRNSLIGGEYNYMGQGGAEIANWARAIMVLREVQEGVFEWRYAKRGTRAGLVDVSGQPAIKIPVQHSKSGLCWEYGPAGIQDDETIDAFVSAVIKAMGMETRNQEWIVNLIHNETGKSRATIFRPGSIANRVLQKVKAKCTSPQAPTLYKAQTDCLTQSHSVS